MILNNSLTQLQQSIFKKQLNNQSFRHLLLTSNIQEIVNSRLGNRFLQGVQNNIENFKLRLSHCFENYLGGLIYMNNLSLI